jgi:hypothetical protein
MAGEGVELWAGRGLPASISGRIKPLVFLGFLLIYARTFATLLDMDSTRFDADLQGLTDGEMVEHLLELHALKARLEGALVAATGAFDRRMLHAADAARTTAGWLAARVDQTRGRCGADVTLARALRSMPVVEAAFRAGRLGRAKVDLLAEVRTPELAEVFAEHEAYLVDEVDDLRVTDAGRFLRAWQQAARLSIGSIDPDEAIVETAPRVAVTLAQTFDGRFVLDGEMDAEHGTIIRSAIDAEVDEMYRVGIFSADDGLSPAERRGHAVVQIFVRKGRVGMRHGRPRPSVEVICDERTLQGLPIENDDDLRTRVCEIADGTPIAPASLSRLLCGADIHRLVIAADGEVLDAGKDIRLANRAQRRALRFRHARHCAFPGCEAFIDWCEAHHVDEWDPDPSNDRGRTDMANLVPLCRYHHHKVHEGGFTLTLEPDGHVQVIRPGPDRCRITPARPWRRPRPASDGPPAGDRSARTPVPC